MFETLTKYLLESKQLALPPLGVFKIKDQSASADVVSGNITPPAVVVEFKTDADATEDIQEALVRWLAGSQTSSMTEARSALTQFISGLETRLDNDQTVDWPGLGVLRREGDHIDFTPVSANLSPFTGVTAQKVLRENTSHATIVGDKETTTSQMREQLLLPDEPRKTGTIMWVLLIAALIAAVVYFAQNGCNPAATGNQQKVESQKPGATYKLQ